MRIWSKSWFLITTPPLFLLEKTVIYSGDEIGPTIGGYFMAGRFGEGSRVYGGFWANVNSLYWLDLQNLQVK
jgi:hypothetical protein